MKATLILLTLIFAAAWAGCSDNMNVTDPFDGHNGIVQNQPKHTTDNGNSVLIWSLNELKVWTVSESMVDNKASYLNPPPVPALQTAKGYMITFEVTTNADRGTNGYAPLVRVSKDDATLYEGSDFTVAGETSVFKEIRFREGEFNQILFYIALFQTDGGSVAIPNNSVFLILSNIKIYRIN
jgi:hypothetical protein